MKYNDRYTRIITERHRDKEDEYSSDRNLRREKERKYKKFASKIYKYVEKDWWDSLTESDQHDIYYSWMFYTDLKYSHRTKSDFETWAKSYFSNIKVKPDPIVYREKRLDRIFSV